MWVGGGGGEETAEEKQHDIMISKGFKFVNNCCILCQKTMYSKIATFAWDTLHNTTLC